MSGVFRAIGTVAGAVATVALVTGNPALAGIASPPSRAFLARVRA
ncbi:hypothetical protein [Erythrobacter aurantius]|nr:hypothetical protein [Erythrobacter aurantius]